MEKEPITSEGLVKIKTELEELKKIKRPKLSQQSQKQEGMVI